MITGASQGLGFAIAQRFADDGAELVLLARNAKELEDAAGRLRQQYPRCVIETFPADVTDEVRLREIFQSTTQSRGIDILVNNAGVYGPIGLLEETVLSDWKYAFDVNFYGTLYPIRLLLSHFKARGYGRIINLSGGGATKGMPGFSCYAAAKAAIVRLTETIAMETSGYDITVNAIAPGALNTRLLQDVLDAGPAKTGAAFYEASIKQQESGGSSLENAAELCAFLALPESDGITGRLISAVWDDWKNLHARKPELARTDVYALRRITAKDRGFDWDDVK